MSTVNIIIFITTLQLLLLWWFLSLIFQVFDFYHVLLSVIPAPWNHMVLDVLSYYSIWLY